MDKNTRTMPKLLFSVLVFLVSLSSAFLNVSAKQWNFTIDVSNSTGAFSHFWKSTGLCPPAPHQEDFKFLLSDDETQNLALIGSVPRHGIEQVRIHWLLDMVTIINFHGNELTYNFTLLDHLIGNLWSNNLRPGFEIMGNPSNHYTDFENDTQVHQWKDLVQTLAERYIGIYGLDYVSKWNFETWNEPDHGDFDGLKFTVQGFMNYYDACSEGLKAADPSLKFGGPAGGCKDPPKSPICWTLLQHCSNGTNYFTNETGVRIDYISFHHKGGGSSMTILNTEFETIDIIRQKYTLLAKVPIFNDEADPLVTWSRPEWWRADTTYAAVVAKIIIQHQHLLITPKPDYRYSLLSNDNGFLNYYPAFFEQRTLNARFQMNNTKPNSVQLIKKPVLVVMGLLSKLGDQLVHVEDLKKTYMTDIGILATTESTEAGWSAAILISNSADTTYTIDSDKVSLTVDGIPADEFEYTRMVPEIRKNTESSIFVLVLQEAVRVEGPSEIPAKVFNLAFTLKKPGIMLVHLCNKSTSAPAQVQNVTVHPVTASDVLVTWSDALISTPCILTFEVEYSTQSETGPFERINSHDITFTSFVFSTDETESIKGWFRVRAVDYWSRAGSYSVAIHFLPQ
ncbi:putative alpha-L-iduronidase [Apostichopus japonicus]|uniref:Putative alpha-L-iduronidase n=1 Tax=Stichopus japonicus TaxID=307972 RepID=A0A2G8LEH8_STIJA|nr:putative alpha-L-iduronidase [Apostichopus japonicus]